MDPRLLDLYEHTAGKPAPAAYLLHVRGNSFELGEEIGDATSQRLEEAWRFLAGVFAESPERWRGALETASRKQIAD